MAAKIGFQLILDRWRSSGRTEEADIVETALRTFDGSQHEVYENLDNDKQISQSRREQLMNQLTMVDPLDQNVVDQTVIGFCWAYKTKGPLNKTAQRAELGHVIMREAFEEILATVRSASSPLSPADAALFVDSLLRRDLAAQQSLLSPPGPRRPLRPRLMWSFYQSQSLDDPFKGFHATRGELIRRLGLGHMNKPRHLGKPLLHWQHRLQDHQAARRPTAFDAADNEFFQPGGKTKPLTGTGGLREVVHPPTDAGQLTRQIQQAT